MARIKNQCHRCRHTWRLKGGGHLDTSCPKCGSQYVGPAPAGGIGLFGLLILAGGALAGAVWLGLIDKQDLPDLPEVPGVTDAPPEQPPPADPKKKPAGG